MNQPCNTCLPPRQSALATLQHMFAATAKCSRNTATRVCRHGKVLSQHCNTCLPPRQSALATLQHMFAATAKCSRNLQHMFAATAKCSCNSATRVCRHGKDKHFSANKKHFPDNLLQLFHIRADSFDSCSFFRTFGSAEGTFARQ